jgi:tripartite-type tricarboxylate transporter receptor subunit TctC
MGQLKAGKLRALGSWGDKRLPALPEVATFREQGLDAEFYIWSGVFAPSGTPAAVMQRLRDALRLAVQDPEFKATMAKIETPVSYLDAPEFARFWDRDARRLANTLEKIGRIEDK